MTAFNIVGLFCLPTKALLKSLNLNVGCTQAGDLDDRAISWSKQGAFGQFKQIQILGCNIFRRGRRGAHETLLTSLSSSACKRLTCRRFGRVGSHFTSKHASPCAHSDHLPRVEVGTGCAAVTSEQMQNLDCRRIQCDKIWAFCRMKQARIPRFTDRTVDVCGDRPRYQTDPGLSGRQAHARDCRSVHGRPFIWSQYPSP
jgi:hypothetical protein